MLQKFNCECGDFKIDFESIFLNTFLLPKQHDIIPSMENGGLNQIPVHY